MNPEDDEPVCNVERVRTLPTLRAGWLDPPWSSVDAILLETFRPESSEHRPLTEARVLHDGSTIVVRFRVIDRFILARRSGYGADVWRDSCVEWFVQPRPNRGYLAFEVNCCGAWRCDYIEDPARTPGGGLRGAVGVPEVSTADVTVSASLGGPLLHEIPGPLEWFVELRVPVSFLEQYVGPLQPIEESRWRTNFTKCADESSHPHWASWSPLSALDFHRPGEFGWMNICDEGPEDL
jgi:hypothetical protein